MSQIYRCDNCQTTTEYLSGWITATEHMNTFEVDIPSTSGAFYRRPAIYRTEDAPVKSHFCGLECLICKVRRLFPVSNEEAAQGVEAKSA